MSSPSHDSMHVMDHQEAATTDSAHVVALLPPAEDIDDDSTLEPVLEQHRVLPVFQAATASPTTSPDATAAAVAASARPSSPPTPANSLVIATTPANDTVLIDISSPITPPNNNNNSNNSSLSITFDHCNDSTNDGQYDDKAIGLGEASENERFLMELERSDPAATEGHSPLRLSSDLFSEPETPATTATNELDGAHHGGSEEAPTRTLASSVDDLLRNVRLSITPGDGVGDVGAYAAEAATEAELPASNEHPKEIRGRGIVQADLTAAGNAAILLPPEEPLTPPDSPTGAANERDDDDGGGESSSNAPLTMSSPTSATATTSTTAGSSFSALQIPNSFVANKARQILHERDLFHLCADLHEFLKAGEHAKEATEQLIILLRRPASQIRKGNAVTRIFNLIRNVERMHARGTVPLETAKACFAAAKKRTDLFSEKQLALNEASIQDLTKKRARDDGDAATTAEHLPTAKRVRVSVGSDDTVELDGSADSSSEESPLASVHFVTEQFSKHRNEMDEQFSRVKHTLTEINGRVWNVYKDVGTIERRSTRHYDQLSHDLSQLKRSMADAAREATDASSEERKSRDADREQMVALRKEVAALRADLSVADGKFLEFDREYRALMQTFREREENRIKQMDSLLECFRQVVANLQQQQQQQQQPQPQQQLHHPQSQQLQQQLQQQQQQQQLHHHHHHQQPQQQQQQQHSAAALPPPAVPSSAYQPPPSSMPSSSSSSSSYAGQGHSTYSPSSSSYNREYYHPSEPAPYSPHSSGYSATAPYRSSSHSSHSSQRRYYGDSSGYRS